MTDHILKVVTSTTDDHKWTLYSFEKLKLSTEDIIEPPILSFASEFKTSLVFGEYTFGNLSVRCSQQTFYGENDESIGLIFQVRGENNVESHGVMMSESLTAVPTDRQGKAIALSGRLPDDFIDWLYSLETLTW